jgi:uncharacterized membrane protein YdbT with pleckstrin-like domain
MIKKKYFCQFTNRMHNVISDIFKNEDIKRDVKEVIKPVVSFIYDEIYVYLWFICLYNVFFILIVLAILYLLIQMPYKINNLGSEII